MVDVKKHRPENLMLLEVGTHTGRVSGLVVELKFLGLFLAKNIAWSSGLVVDVKKYRPEKVMWVQRAPTGIVV